MALFGLKLSPDTHDLVIENGQLVIISDDEVIARNLESRLSTLKGEWILDTSYGYEYRNALGARVTDLQLIESSIKSYILDTEGVTSISTFKLDYEPANQRRLIITFGVLTVNNTIVEIGGVTLG